MPILLQQDLRWVIQKEDVDSDQASSQLATRHYLYPSFSKDR